MWAFAQLCGLSPAEVSDMGWFDLAQFTLKVDDHNDEVAARLRHANAAANYSAPTGTAGMQRL